MRHPGARALVLGLCLCSLYIGYEFARASSLVLFASRAAGVNGAYTASGGFFLSIATLALYGRGVELMGAKRTLLVSAAGCCAVFLGLAAALSAYEPDAIPWAFVACLFAFRETYVSLIGTQVWALVSAELKERGPETSRTWFCIIQGVSCICSAFAGMAAGRLATAGGQFFLLLAAALSLVVITVAVAVTSGDTLGGGVSIGKGGSNGKLDSGGLLRVLRSSVSLFRRCPLLAALLAEAMVCQVLTATLNVSFNEAIRQSLVSQASAEPEAQAAGFVGKSFAFIGLLSGALQLIVMPWAMLRVNPSLLLRTLPLVAGSGLLATLVSPGFRTTTVAFAITKILDYSVRGTALELVYQPMPEHERLLGKEAIATVGVRIGRTVAHVALYCCLALLEGAPPQRVLMGVALASAALWAVALRRVELLARGGEGSSRIVSAGAVGSDRPETSKLGEGANGLTNGRGRGNAAGERPRPRLGSGRVDGVVFCNSNHRNGLVSAVAVGGGGKGQKDL